jgi:hypothetical protein
MLLGVPGHLAGFFDADYRRSDDFCFGGAYRSLGCSLRWRGLAGFNDLVEVFVLVVFGLCFPDVGFVV